MKIVLSVVLAMFIVGCSDEKGAQKSTQESNMPQSVEKVAVQADVQEVVKKVEKKEEKSVVQTVEKTKAVVPAVTATSNVDGAKLFVACSSCHGAKAEKKALGKSQIIKDWDETKIVTALKGYKDGTYGGAMKAVMKGQATKLSDADIKALAEYISKL
jgi:cytochrome c553